MINHVRSEIENNRIQSVTICRYPTTGNICLLVKWDGPGPLTSWVFGNDLPECFAKLSKLELPRETWAARLQARRANSEWKSRYENRDSDGLSFDQYLRSLGLGK